jgi:hypothetical protein
LASCDDFLGDLFNFGGDDDNNNITRIEIVVPAPAIGVAPVTTGEGITITPTPTASATFTSLTWLRVVDGTPQAFTGNFQVNGIYQARVTLQVTDGFNFIATGANTTVRTINNGATTLVSNIDGTVIITRNFPSLQPGTQNIANITIALPVPETGVLPSTATTTGVSGNASPNNDAIEITDIAWYRGSGAPATANLHTTGFEREGIYRVVVTLEVESGFTFVNTGNNNTARTINGETISATNTTVSGNTVTLTRTFVAGDPITSIFVNGITLPVGGVSPVTATTGLTITTAPTAGAASFPANSLVEWLTTDGVAHTTAFQTGTTYQARVTVQANNGFVIRAANNPTVQINGEPATVYSNSNGRIVIRRNIAAADATITYTVTANGLVGETASDRLNFVFSADPGNLLANEILITELKGGSATRGTLTGTGVNRTLGLNNATGGSINVAITRSGIETGQKPVTLFRDTRIPFDLEQYGGEENNKDSTHIKIIFEHSIDRLGLLFSHITVDDDIGQATRGNILQEQPPNNGRVFHIDLTKVDEQGYVNVSIDGAGIATAAKAVKVYKKDD